MAITRGDFRNRLRLRLADTSATPFFTSTYLNDVINIKIRSIADYICSIDPAFYMQTTTITGITDAVADTNNEEYAMPSGSKCLVNLYRQLGTGSTAIYRPLEVINAEEHELYRYHYGTRLAMYAQNYQFAAFETVSFRNNNLRILPAPTSTSFVYKLEYIRQPTLITNDNDDIDIPPSWEEVLAMECCVLSLARDGSPLVASWQQLLDREWKIRRQEWNRRIMPINPIPPLRFV